MIDRMLRYTSSGRSRIRQYRPIATGDSGQCRQSHPAAAGVVSAIRPQPEAYAIAPLHLLCILALLACSQAARPAHAATAPAARPTAVIDPEWIRLNPRNPSMLFAGGTGQMYRSTDAGNSWIQVMGNLPVPDSFCPAVIDGPAALSSDGQHLVVVASKGCPPNSRIDFGSLFMSPDAGLSVDSGALIGSPEGAFDPYSPITSPAAPLRFYALVGGDGSSEVWNSGDGGHSWDGGGNQIPDNLLGSGGDIQSITADPIMSSTVYVNLGFTDSNYHPHSAGAVRSDDAGATWTTIISPTVTPALRSFAIHTNPLLPGTLIGQTADKAIAPDVRYYSDDSGHTWATGACIGDLHGSCPSITIGSAFGAGYSYAFTNGGIYPFTGRGGAGARLAISDRLPVPASTISDTQAGAHPGNPVFILAGGQVYRSGDSGQTWRLLTVIQGPTPNLLPPSTAKGALLVRQTHHVVAPAFVAAYKKLGLLLTGYPVTESYLENGTLYQDFQRLRLRLGGLGAVKVAPLGTSLFTLLTQEPGGAGAIYRRAALPAAPVPTIASQRYFAATKHVLRQPLLGFWQQHGGLAVFGPPISEVFHATNGDGSGRLYAMQYFANARLELHPEIHDPRYTVQPGLLGSESLVARGWAPTNSR
jgi:photosystem II stability/assembly factor-like uncharacterized protein